MALINIKNNRTEEIRVIGAKLMEERFCNNLDKFYADYSINGKTYIQQFEKTICGLYELGIQKQKNMKKGNIAYISVFYLRSAEKLGKHTCMIALYDETRYEDRVEVSCEWNTDFLMKYYDEDVAYIRKELPGKVIQLTNAELERFISDYAGEYYSVIGNFIYVNSDFFYTTSPYEQLQRQDEVSVTFGGYMEEGVEVNRQ